MEYFQHNTDNWWWNIQDRSLLCACHINCSSNGSCDDPQRWQTPLSSSCNYQVASPECFRLLSSQSERRHRAVKDTKIHWLLTFWHQTRTRMVRHAKAHGKQRTIESRVHKFDFESSNQIYVWSFWHKNQSKTTQGSFHLWRVTEFLKRFKLDVQTHSSRCEGRANFHLEWPNLSMFWNLCQSF